MSSPLGSDDEEIIMSVRSPTVLYQKSQWKRLLSYIHAYAHVCASESVESLSASSSAASDQNFLTPTLHDLLLILLVSTP